MIKIILSVKKINNSRRNTSGLINPALNSKKKTRVIIYHLFLMIFPSSLQRIFERIAGQKYASERSILHNSLKRVKVYSSRDNKNNYLQENKKVQ